MNRKLKLVSIVLTLALLLGVAQGALACTCIAVGKNATTDGSTIVTHNDDSGSADFRLWIIPSMEGGADKTRDLVIDSHNYGDFGQYPAVKDYGNGLMIAQVPQPKDTNAYFHSRYSFINDKGVAMGESTFNIDDSTEYGKKVSDLIYGKNDGAIDCWNAQDIALEQANTAREAVQIMGDLTKEFMWRDSGECMDICDGNEVWIAEFYGLDLWCAVRLPDDAYFVTANRARIDHVDFEDHENYMYSDNLKSFAVENGLWSEDSGVPFSPAEIYAPSNSRGCQLREWRALDLVAPGLNLDSESMRYPLWVIPEKKLSVKDVFAIKSDYYQGTEFDLSLEPGAGPFGNVLTQKRNVRPINLANTCYVMIANIKADVPGVAKPLVWYGYGAADTTYLTPLWPSMTRMPDFYSIGNRYEEFRRDSGWWTNSYVQQIAAINYKSAVEVVHAAREDKMNAQYDIVPSIQKAAAILIEEGKEDVARELITTYACTNATEWHDMWLKLGDDMMGTYMWGRVDMASPKYPEWWNEIIKNAPRNPGVEEEAPK
ncbi:MAG: C69 family dipeptidase [Clostridia bacterium]